jgi:hypothetical protein
MITRIINLILDKFSVGLGNVDNTADSDKPVSNATQTALDSKVDKVTGKGLSTEDYTTAEKTKLAAISGTNTGDQDLTPYELTANKGALNGYASLVNGVIPESQLPPVAITDTFPVNSQTEMLALVAQTGDVAVRSDLNKSFILKTEPASTLINWIELLSPTAPVQSVNGQTGAVSLNSDNIGEGTTNRYYLTARETSAKDRANHTGTQDISTVLGLQTALDGKAATSHTHVISDIINLQTTLDGKSETSHTHTASQITDFNTAVATQVTDKVSNSTDTFTSVDSVLYIVTLTKAEYDAISIKNPNTLYFTRP